METVGDAVEETQPGEWIVGRAWKALLATPFPEREPALSPGGRFRAYPSDESGRPEVYLNAFPDAGRKWPVSTDGAENPSWARSGGELFYLQGNKLLAVSVDSGREPPSARPSSSSSEPFPEERFSTSRATAASSSSKTRRPSLHPRSSSSCRIFSPSSSVWCRRRTDESSVQMVWLDPVPLLRYANHSDD